MNAAMNVIRSWIKDPFGKKKAHDKHVVIQRELQLVRGKVELRTKDLERYPYRALHKNFQAQKGEADVQLPQ